MFGLGFLYRKAQATVDNAIAQLVWGLIMAVPLIIALGFATAAGSSYLHRHYEPEIADLIMAGIYLAVAIGAAMIYAVRRPETAAIEEAKAQEQADKQADETVGSSALGAISTAERDILLAALTSAAPYAIRPILGTVFRNLPLLLVLAVTAFVLTRGSSPTDSDNPAPEADMAPPDGVPAE